MENPRIFEKAASLLTAGENIALVTVIGTAGSTPGKVSYKMLVDSGTETIGTVGGGLVEAEVIKQAAGMLAKATSRVVHFEFGETPEDEKGICGGSVEMLIESFDTRALPLFKALRADDEGNTSGVLVSIISPDHAPQKILLRNAEQVATTANVRFGPKALEIIRQATAEKPRGTRMTVEGMDLFVESMAASPIVVLFGAGHLSYHIARYAKSVGFAVSVFDDRSEYANHERFPDADEIVVGDFARVAEHIRSDAHSYIVIVTRGHSCDEIVLEQALETDAAYIGMIGSKRKTQAIFEKLRARGVTQQALRRVYSPIGFSLGAITPEEIALSIVCELVKIRRLGREHDIRHMTISQSEVTR
jgi:xanthine dehydrogenase accessory factor